MPGPNIGCLSGTDRSQADGVSVKSARKAAACATSHSRAVTGPCGGRGRRAGSAVFFVCLGAEGVRAGSQGCGMPDLKRLGSLGVRVLPAHPGQANQNRRAILSAVSRSRRRELGIWLGPRGPQAQPLVWGMFVTPAYAGL